jgi:hypothetical protein
VTTLLLVFLIVQTAVIAYLAFGSKFFVPAAAEQAYIRGLIVDRR